MPTALSLSIDSSGARKGADEYNSASSKISQASEHAAKSVDHAEHQVDLLGKTVHEVTHVLTGFFAVFAAEKAIEESVHHMIQAEAAFKRMGLAARYSGEEFEQIESSIDKLASTGLHSAATLATSFTDIDKNVRNASRSFSVLSDAEKLNIVTGGELDDTASMLVQTMQLFNLGFSQSAHVSDLFAKLQVNSSKEVGALSERVKMSMSAFKDFNYSIEDSVALMDALSKAGFTGNLGLNKFIQLMRTLSDPTNIKDTTATLKEMGLTLADINPSTQSASELAQKLADHHLTLARATDLVGRQQANLLLAFAGSAKVLGDVRKEYENVSGTTDKLAASLSNTAEVAIKKFGNSLLFLGESLVKWLNEPIIKTTQFLRDVTLVILGYEDQLSKAKDGSLQFGDATKETARAIVIFGVAAEVFGAVATAIAIARIAMNGLNAAMLANPFGILLAAISTVIGVLYTFRDETISIGDTTGTVGEFCTAVWEEFKDRIFDIIKQLTDAWKAFFSWLKDQFTSLTDVLDAVAAGLSAVPFAQAPVQAAVNALRASILQSGAQTGKEYASQFLDEIKSEFANMPFILDVRKRMQTGLPSGVGITAGEHPLLPKPPEQDAIEDARKRAKDAQDRFDQEQARQHRRELEEKITSSAKGIPDGLAKAVGDGVVNALTGKFDPAAFAQALETALASGVIQSVFVTPLQSVLELVMRPFTDAITDLGASLLGDSPKIAAETANTGAVASLTGAVIANTGAVVANTGAVAGSAGSNAITAGSLAIPAAALAFADGGVVNKPTYALIGEAGPEAVIPLNKYANGNVFGDSLTSYMNSTGGNNILDLLNPLHAVDNINRLMGQPTRHLEHPQYTDARAFYQAAEQLRSTQGPRGSHGVFNAADNRSPASYLGFLFPDNANILGDIGNSGIDLLKTLGQVGVSAVPSGPGQTFLRYLLNAIPSNIFPSTLNPNTVRNFASGGVFGTPTYFNNSVMGEAGPEAVMPLTRGADGKLGVKSSGGHNVTVHQHIYTPDSNSFRKSSKQIYREAQRLSGGR